jgi:hypothetical protein
MTNKEEKKMEKKTVIDAIFVYSPEKELDVLAQLAKKGNSVDWKPAIILAAAYLERFGIEKLKRHFKDRKIKLSKRLESLSLNEVAIFLYGLEMIDDRFFTFMTHIWSERRKIVHQKGTLPAYVGDEANQKYGKMLKNALEIITSLKS